VLSVVMAEAALMIGAGRSGNSILLLYHSHELINVPNESTNIADMLAPSVGRKDVG
jgi:hypothetical protein